MKFFSSKSLIYAAVLCAAAAYSVPAFATNGKEAIAMCKKKKGCFFGQNADGSNIDIVTGDGKHIYCKDQTSECTVSRTGNNPNQGTGAGALGQGNAVLKN